MKQARSLALVLTALLATGCAQQKAAPPATEQQLTNAMATQLAQIETLLVKRCDAEVAATVEYQTKMLDEMSGMNVGLLALAEKASAPPVICPEPEDDPLNLGDKFVLGEVERVFIPAVSRGFDARVDTGAVTSSISATNVRLFERNGEQWVRFDIPSSETPEPAKAEEGEAAAEGEEQAAPATTMEARVARFVNIKKASTDEPQRRPVIRTRVQLGDYVTEAELNLTDRSHMEYPVLLGRKFFQDIAVVDVSRKYIHSSENGQKAPE
ncbi:ATP-dependent zinc protease [Marinobacter hydrocarbonoclasticus]|nr:ATP-dependent zinc protease [Marinobacter nauticus]